MFNHVVLFCAFLFVIYRAYHLAQNYLIARQLGLPIILLPTSFQEPLWILLRPMFAWVQHLPFGLASWYFYTDIGWPMIDRMNTHSRLGDTFILVSPSLNQIITAYPPAAENLYQKYKIWLKPPVVTNILDTFGKSVASTNGQDWQRHRKIVAPAFNDHNYSFVWDEAVKQCQGWLSLNEQTGQGQPATLGKIKQDVSIMAIHVLAAVGFGKQTDFSTGAQQRPSWHRLTLIEALNFILNNIQVTLLFAGIKVPMALLPPPLKRLKTAVQEFKLYMEEAVMHQMKRAHSTTDNPATTLVGALVQANDEEKQTSSSRPNYLTNDELYGNLFIMNFAGFETTAGTMTFALAYLAAHPAIQAWVAEEVAAHCTPASPTSYTATFPKLIRCQALMHETLRLISQAPQLPRAAHTPQPLPVAPGAFVTVPPGTYVSVHHLAVHLNSATWGADAAQFNPRRFVRVDGATGDERLAAPPEGAGFVGWGVGPRICPGKKFSQVEFVAVVSEVLKEYEVVPVVKPGEVGEEARARLARVVDDFDFNVGTRLRRPADAGVRFLRRRKDGVE